jgi:hypothetical protein
VRFRSWAGPTGQVGAPACQLLPSCAEVTVVAVATNTSVGRVDGDRLAGGLSVGLGVRVGMGIGVGLGVAVALGVGLELTTGSGLVAPAAGWDAGDDAAPSPL